MQLKVLYMESPNYQNDLSHIRSMMEKSSRFISLSGLSGVFAGLTALVGAAYVYGLFRQNGIRYFENRDVVLSVEFVQKLFIAGIIILIVAVGFGYFFTARKSKRQGLKIWNSTTRRLLLNFGIPLLSGGIFCLGLLYHGLFGLIAPATLVFYGLALVNAAKYTLSDVQYLGYFQIALGLVALFFLGWGLLFWALGFGLLHIVYGMLMYRKYQ